MIRRALLVMLVAFALAACGRHRVVTQPDGPALAPPPPPPRVVTPPEPEEERPVAPEPDHKAPRRIVPKPEPPPKTEPPKRETPSKPETPPTPVEQQQPPPPTTLQTPANQGELERQALGLLSQAAGDLKRVPYGSLTADGKGQYDTAKRFIEQAQQALKQQNFVLAQRLADKAATIAAVLVGR